MRPLPFGRITGHQKNRQIGAVAPQPQGKGNPVHARHDNIGQKQIEGLAIESRQRLKAIFHGHDLMTLMIKGTQDEFAHRAFIFCHKDAGHRLNARRQ